MPDTVTEQVGGRLTNGQLPSFTSVGAYTLTYITRDNDVLCAKCATDQIDNEDNDTNFDPVITADVYYEGPDMQCDNCYAVIESAYGDPEESNA